MNSFKENENQVNEKVNEVALAFRSLRKQPFKGVYIKLIAIIFFALNTLTIQESIEILNSIEFNISLKIADLNPIYTICWALTLLILFMLAVNSRIKELDQSVKLNLASNSPIKGLLSFNSNDSEIFKNLERNVEIQKYKSALLNPKFRIGILMGLSGCGKTSILQAGLAPELNNTPNTKCIVVTFSNSKPLESIIESLEDEFPSEIIQKEDTLNNILQSIPHVKNHGNLILIFDQFEQFFSQNPIAEDRKQFINQILTVYSQTKEIKILLSIRSDFSGNLHEIQLSLNYILDAVSNYFELKRFYPAQVVRIIKYVALTENLEEDDIDTKFLEKLVANELCGEDGLVSAANLQILLWIMKSKSAVHNLSFTEKGFRQLGGIEGLLQSFIEEQLALPNSFNKNNDVLHCLLALIDLNTNLRAGQITVQKIQARLVSSFNFENLQTILDWLESLRLVNKIQSKNSDIKYELAHERLIEPIRNIENITGSDSRKATQLLERRTNEWMSNFYSNRYILTFTELKFIQRNKKLLTWGDNENVKKEYLTKSLHYFRNILLIFTGIISIFVLAILFINTTYYKIEIKSKNNIKQFLLSNINTITPDLIVLDSLMNLDPVFVKEYCYESKNDDLKLSYAHLILRRDTNDNTIENILKITYGIENNSNKIILLIKIANAIQKKDKIKSDSLYLLATNLYVKLPQPYSLKDYTSNIKIQTFLNKDYLPKENLLLGLIKYGNLEALHIIDHFYKTKDTILQIELLLTKYNYSKKLNLPNASEYLIDAIKLKNLTVFSIDELELLTSMASYQSKLNKVDGKNIYEQAINIASSASLFEQDEEEKNDNISQIIKSLIVQQDYALKLRAIELLSNLTTSAYRSECIDAIIPEINANSLVENENLAKKLIEYLNGVDTIERLAYYAQIMTFNQSTNNSLYKTLLLDFRNTLPSLDNNSQTRFKSILEKMAKVGSYSKKEVYENFLSIYTQRTYIKQSANSSFNYGDYNSALANRRFNPYYIIIDSLIIKGKENQNEIISKIIKHVYTAKDSLEYNYISNAFSQSINRINISQQQVDSLIFCPIYKNDFKQLTSRMYNIKDVFPQIIKLHQVVLDSCTVSLTNELDKKISYENQIYCCLVSNIYASIGMYKKSYSLINIVRKNTLDPKIILNNGHQSILLFDIYNLLKYEKRENHWKGLL